MQALILSDLHLDFQYEIHAANIKSDYSDEEAADLLERWWEMSGLPQTDALITAGDISNDWGSFKQITRFLSGKYKHVYFVPGNHDLVVRGGTCSTSNQGIKDSDERLRLMQSHCDSLGNFHMLNPGTVNGISGCMGMCDFKCGMASHNTLLQWRNHWFDGVHWDYMDQRPVAIWEHYDALMTGLCNQDTKVMMTHFCPIQMGIHPDYRTSSSTTYFYFNADKYFDQLPDGATWVCGHVHNPFSVDYVTADGKTIHIRCNPYGYPGERKFYEHEKFIIEVPDEK